LLVGGAPTQEAETIPITLKRSKDLLNISIAGMKTSAAFLKQ